jgi:hypothetical protein
MRVFVSSTCYDLIDLRAEVEAHLRDIGLRPILSDRPSSDFAEFAVQNSIAACLANVASADAFVCVLSQRYGSSLIGAGFEDLSATHAEVREAHRLGKPIYLYVRDRFLADYGIWRANPGAKLSWVKEEKDRRLFELFAEHEKLSPDRANWFWTFRDSVELCGLLTQHLSGYSGRELLARWTREGRLPIIGVQGDSRRTVAHNAVGVSIRVFVRSADTRVFGLKVAIAGMPDTEFGDLDSRSGLFKLEIVIQRDSLPAEREVSVEYMTDFGAVIRDVFAFRYDGGNNHGTVELRKKRVMRTLPPEIE